MIRAARLAVAGSLLVAVSCSRPAPAGEGSAPPPTVDPTLVVRQDLSVACARAVAPLRARIAHPGRTISTRQLADIRSLAESSYDDCSAAEFVRFRDEELVPWLRTLRQASGH